MTKTLIALAMATSMIGATNGAFAQEPKSTVSEQAATTEHKKVTIKKVTKVTIKRVVRKRRVFKSDTKQSKVHRSGGVGSGAQVNGGF